MGLFDKRDKRKKDDDFDSPIEQIDLSAPSSATPMMREPRESLAPSERGPTTARTAGAVAAREPDQAHATDDAGPGEDDAPESSSPVRYGINDAIELMRALPQDNVELVVQIVKRTLESVNATRLMYLRKLSIAALRPSSALEGADLIGASLPLARAATAACSSASSAGNR